MPKEEAAEEGKEGVGSSGRGGKEEAPKGTGKCGGAPRKVGWCRVLGAASVADGDGVWGVNAQPACYYCPRAWHHWSSGSPHHCGPA